jgi:hypothetical protein
MESNESTWSQLAFPASPSPTPAAEKRKRTSGGSGRRLPDAFATFDPVTCSWRTSAVSLAGEWARFSATWPRSGSMRSGVASERPTWELPTSASGFSSWPTPSAGNFNDGESLESWQARRDREAAKGRNGNGMGTPLGVAVQLWATPAARDWRSGNSNLMDANSRPLSEQASNGKGGALNPAWVEALMGYPNGWTWAGIAGRRRRAPRTTGSRPVPSPAAPSPTAASA